MEVIIANMDILKLPEIYDSTVEAVVNSTNTTFPGAAGLDKQIHKHGSKALKKELKAVGLKHKNVGDAFVTSAPGLSYTYIIHTIVPKWGKEDAAKSKEALKKCYSNIWKAADEKRIKSVVFLALGIGHMGVPIQEGAEAAVESLKAYMAQDKASVECVYFILSENDIADVYIRTMEHMGVEYESLSKTMLEILDSRGKDLVDGGYLTEEQVELARKEFRAKKNILIDKLMDSASDVAKRGIKMVKDKPETVVALAVLAVKALPNGMPYKGRTARFLEKNGVDALKFVLKEQE